MASLAVSHDKDGRYGDERRNESSREHECIPDDCPEIFHFASPVACENHLHPLGSAQRNITPCEAFDKTEFSWVSNAAS